MAFKVFLAAFASAGPWDKNINLHFGDVMDLWIFFTLFNTV